ncbi:MAG: type IV toxin-antitoxin system AbiEi family antitoxin domain-containing protein [Dermatophilaceae bacterium]
MGALRAQDASRLGMHRTTLHRRARTGSFERIARGIYRPAGAEPADNDLIEAAVKRPDAILCLASALAYHDLVDDIPDAADLAIPRGSRIPATEGAVAWHSFARETFAVGRTGFPIPGTDLEIGIYTPERCIVDAFRLRGHHGYETGPDALREWLRRGGKPAALIEIADQIPRAAGPLNHALEHLA